MLDAIFVEITGEALSRHCPLASADPEAIENIKRRILKYDAELAKAPNPELVLTWAAPLEQALREKKELAEAEVRQAQERRLSARRERSDYLAGSAYDRARVVEEFRARQTSTEPQMPFTPAREYTQEEIDAMSGDEYKRLILGVDNLALNESRPDEQMTQHLKKRVLTAKKNDPLSRALRAEIRGGLR